MSDIVLNECIEYDTSRLTSTESLVGYKKGFHDALNNEIFTLCYYNPSYQLGYKKGYGHGSYTQIHCGDFFSFQQHCSRGRPSAADHGPDIHGHVRARGPALGPG